MSARLLHISDPFSPSVGARNFDVPAGLTTEKALANTGWKLPPRTVLLKREIAAGATDPADVFVRRCDWDDELLGDEDEAIFLTLPAGGRGASQVFSVLSSIALMVAAPYAAPELLGAMGINASATVLGVSALKIATAVTYVGGQMLISSLLPAPKPYAPASTVSPTYTLSAQSNTARLGNAIPEAFGTNMIMMDLISSPYFDFVDNRQRVMQLFCVGIGEYDIHQIRADTAVIWQDGSLMPSYEDVEVEVLGPDDPVTLIEDNVVTSTEVSAIELLGTNEKNYATVGPYVASGPGQLAIKLGFDVCCPGGLYSVDSSGHLTQATVAFKFQTLSIDDAGNPTGIWQDALSTSLTMATRGAVSKTYEIVMPPGRYKTRGVRTNQRSTDNNTADVIQWFALRAYLPSQYYYRGITKVAVRATGTANLNGNALQKLNVIATRKLPRWDQTTRTWSAPTATRAIAPMAAYLLKTIAGRNDGEIDLDALASLSATWASRGDWFDGVFDSRKSLWQDGLEPVLRVGRTRPLLIGNKITFVRDERKTSYSAGFSPRNMLANTFSIDFTFQDDASPDGLVFKFIDNRTWQENQILCALAGSTATIDSAAPMQVFGITDRDHMWREGMNIVADSFYRRRVASFGTAREGMACLPGSLTKVAHWLANWGTAADVIDLKHDDAGDLLTLSEPWSPPKGEAGDNVIMIAAPDGNQYGPVTFDLVDDGELSTNAVIRLTSTAMLAGKYAGTEPRDWPVWDGEGLKLERPRAMLGKGTQVPRDALFATLKPDRGGRTATVTAIIDDQRVYDADTGPVPPETTGSPAGYLAIIIDHINVNERTVTASPGPGESGRYAGDFTIFGAGNAVSFSMQWRSKPDLPIGSSDFGDWTPVVSTGTQFTIDTFLHGPVQVRACAKNAHGQYGPWFTFEFYADGQADTAPGDVGNVARDAVWASGTVQHFSWPTTAQATKYHYQFIARRGGGDYFTAREGYIVENEFTYYPSDEIDDGGPFIRGYLQIKAVNAAGESPDWIAAPNTNS